MLFRPRDIATRGQSTEDAADIGVIAIPQPSHSWLSGQLVRAWGNDRFARPTPYEEDSTACEVNEQRQQLRHQPK